MTKTREKTRKLEILATIDKNQIPTFENPWQLFLALTVGPGIVSIFVFLGVEIG